MPRSAPEIIKEIISHILLNMYGLYSRESGIVEDGVYDSDFLTITKEKNGTLHLQLTFTPTYQKFNSDQITINLSIEDGGIFNYPNKFLDYLKAGKNLKKIPKKEMYYIGTFSSIVTHTYKFRYFLYSKLNDYYKKKIVENKNIDEVLH